MKFNPDPGQIFFGILIIVLLHIIPIIPVGALAYLAIGSQYATVAQYSDFCLDYNRYCDLQMISIVYYVGILLGIYFVIFGIFRRDKDDL